MANKTLKFEYHFPDNKSFHDFSNEIKLNDIETLIAKFERSQVKFGLSSSDEYWDKLNHVTNFQSWLYNFEVIHYDIRKAYAFMMYYHSQEIPDRPEGFAYSPFQNFKGQDYYNISMFRFFAEAALAKTFSALDNLVTILDHFYPEALNLNKKNYYFHTAIDKLAKKYSTDQVILKLNKIIIDKQYNILKQFRNDIAHNKSPFLYNPRLIVATDGQRRTLGESSYRDSETVRTAIEVSISSLNRICKIIHENLDLDKDFGVIYPNNHQTEENPPLNSTH